MGTYERILADLPFLARLPEGDRRELVSLGKVRDYVDGTVLFRQGDHGGSMHVIVDGSVRVIVLSAEGEEATVALLGRGECLGELALLDGRPRSATAIASGAARSFVVERGEFIHWLLRNPRAALVLLETLSVRFRRKDQAYLDMVFMNLPQRLAKCLVDLAVSQTGGQTYMLARKEIHLRMTQEQLASMLGASRQAVNKELNALALKGWIALRRGSIRLENFAAIRRLSEGVPD